MKECSRCHQERERSEFDARKSSPDGLAGQCKECRREIRRLRYPQIREAERERLGRYRAENHAHVRQLELARARRNGIPPMPTLAGYVQNAEVTDSGCRIWPGHIDTKGYGRWGQQLAHHAVAELAGVQVPAGREFHHECRTPACINLAHFRILTPSEHTELHHQEA